MADGVTRTLASDVVKFWRYELDYDRMMFDQGYITWGNLDRWAAKWRQFRAACTGYDARVDALASALEVLHGR